MNNLNAQQYYTALKAHFYASRNSEHAAPMKSYMKNQFDYLGIKAPLRKELFKTFFKKEKLPELSVAVDLSKLLWKDPYREMNYVALDILEKNTRKFDDSHQQHFVWLITNESWWDTVDLIASNLVGKTFLKFPDKKIERTKKWNESDNMWLQRTSILFQLKYREQTDFELLKKYILNHIDSKEFFIQKASGWALRQYSKYNPIAVREFINEHRTSLSKLAIKEGSKYL